MVCKSMICLWRRCIHFLFLCRASENRKYIYSNLQPYPELHKDISFYKWSFALFHVWSTSFYENDLEIIFIQVATKIFFQDCWYWMEKKKNGNISVLQSFSVIHNADCIEYSLLSLTTISKKKTVPLTQLSAESMKVQKRFKIRNSRFNIWSSRFSILN